MNKIEQEVFECFNRPRTLEDGYNRSQFNNIHNFKMYVDRLIARGELDEELKITHKNNFFEEIRVFSQKKAKKEEPTEKINNFISGLGVAFCITTLFFSWYNINILELF